MHDTEPIQPMALLPGRSASTADIPAITNDAAHHAVTAWMRQLLRSHPLTGFHDLGPKAPHEAQESWCSRCVWRRWNAHTLVGAVCCSSSHKGSHCFMAAPMMWCRCDVYWLLITCSEQCAALHPCTHFARCLDVDDGLTGTSLCSTAKTQQSRAMEQ